MKTLNINDGIIEYSKTQRAILLDVRTEEEYKEGHIDGSVNIPLQIINKVLNEYPDKSTAIYVHCRSGVRSLQAAKYLESMGYKNIIDIGGILSYSGKIIK